MNSVDVIKPAEFIVNVQNDSVTALVFFDISQPTCESSAVLFPDALLQHFCSVLRVPQSKPLGIYSFEISYLLIEKKCRDGAQSWGYSSVGRVIFSVACMKPWDLP